MIYQISEGSKILNYYDNLKEHQIELPKPAAKGGVYSKFTYTSNGTLYFSSGVGCKKNGTFLYTGHVGSEVSIEQAQEAAKQCILNIVSNIEEEFGDLNRVTKILKMTGFVNSADDFGGQPAVMDAASSTLIEIFGEVNGCCARSAIGVNTLPGNQAVEIEIVFEAKQA